MEPKGNLKLQKIRERINELADSGDSNELLQYIDFECNDKTDEDIDAISSFILLKDKDITQKKIENKDTQDTKENFDEAVNKAIENKYQKIARYWVPITIMIPVISTIVYWGVTVCFTTDNISEYIMRILKFVETNSENIKINRDIIKTSQSEIEKNLIEMQQSVSNIQELLRTSNIKEDNLTQQINDLSHSVKMLDREMQLILNDSQKYNINNKNIKDITDTK